MVSWPSMAIYMVQCLLESTVWILVVTIHISPFMGIWFTDFPSFTVSFFPQQEGSFCPFTHSLGNHRPMLHSFTPFTRIHSSNQTNSGQKVWMTKWRCLSDKALSRNMLERKKSTNGFETATTMAQPKSRIRSRSWKPNQIKPSS